MTRIDVDTQSLHYLYLEEISEFKVSVSFAYFYLLKEDNILIQMVELNDPRVCMPVTWCGAIQAVRQDCHIISIFPRHKT